MEIIENILLKSLVDSGCWKCRLLRLTNGSLHTQFGKDRPQKQAALSSGKPAFTPNETTTKPFWNLKGKKSLVQ